MKRLLITFFCLILLFACGHAFSCMISVDLQGAAGGGGFVSFSVKDADNNQIMGNQYFGTFWVNQTTSSTNQPFTFELTATGTSNVNWTLTVGGVVFDSGFHQCPPNLNHLLAFDCSGPFDTACLIVTPSDYNKTMDSDTVETDFDVIQIENCGDDSVNWTAQVIHDPWQDVTPPATPVQWPASTFAEGKLLVAGGLTTVNPGTLFNRIQIYDTATGTWTISAPMSTPVFSAVAEYYQGYVYVVGGYTNDSFFATNQVQVYSIASDSWSSGATMPTARGGNVGGIIGDRIYSLGGSATSSFPTENVAYEYNITQNTWTTMNNGPISSSGYGIILGGGTAYDGKIYAGGHFLAVHNQFYEFDPAGNGTWTTRATPPAAFGNLTPSFIPLENDGFILGVGAGNDWNKTGTTYTYNPLSNTWTNLNKPMTVVVLGGAAGANDNEILFYGGTTGDGPVSPAPFMRLPFSAFQPVNWLSLSDYSGTLSVSGTDTVDLTFNSTGLPEGAYPADILFEPGAHIVSVTLFVEDTTPADPPLNPDNCRTFEDVYEICYGDSVYLEADYNDNDDMLYWFDHSDSPAGDPADAGYVASGSYAEIFPDETAEYFAWTYNTIGGHNWSAGFCSVEIQVHALPEMTCPGNLTVDENDDPVDLSELSPLEPSGGSFSGAGVIDDIFHPSIAETGIHTITYTGTDPVTECTNICTFLITVTGEDPEPPPIPATGPFGIGLLLLALGGLIKFARRKI